MERMTRNDAAAYLGVDPQTITNWVNKGLLGGYNDKSSKRFWVNADDVKKYSEKYKMLSVSEDLLDREQKELLASERKVNAKMQMLMHDALNVSSFSYDKIGGSLCTLLELTSQGGMREKKIMQAFFNGDRISNIAEELELSRERVRQIVVKAIRKFNYAIKELADLKQENNSLKEEIKNVKMQLIMQEGEEEEQSEDVPPSVFSIRLVNCNLPVRVLNVTKAADIDTIGDLVQYSKFEMVKFRNFGKKSLMQLDEFIHEMGLEWGMDKAKIYARGIQRMKDDTYIEELFRMHLADITSDIEEKYNLSPAEAMKRAYSEMKRYVGHKENNNE
nr:MAG TPA: DNA-directed RNA polymerase subunit alpha [Caudoviricetes sp.]